MNFNIFEDKYFSQDGRGFHSVVRILGAARHRLKTTLNCACEDKRGYRTVVEVDVRQNKEHWNLPYSSYYFNCIMRGNFRPVKVALMQEGKLNSETSGVEVQYPPEQKAKEADSKMGLCVKPLYGGYDRALWLVEFINMYQILGVTNFIFYNHSVGPSVDQLLHHYQVHGNDTGIDVKVLRWNLPVESQMRIRTEAQFTALNDCNFRFINKVKYAAMVDLDEFLIPNIHNNLTSLLDELNKPNVASFSFQNTFFYLYWSNNTAVEDMEVKVPGYLVTMYKGLFTFYIISKLTYMVL